MTKPKRPIKADYIAKYGFEGERIWRYTNGATAMRSSLLFLMAWGYGLGKGLAPPDFTERIFPNTLPILKICIGFSLQLSIAFLGGCKHISLRFIASLLRKHCPPCLPRLVRTLGRG